MRYRRGAWLTGIVLGAITVAASVVTGLLGPVAIALYAVALSLPVWSQLDYTVTETSPPARFLQAGWGGTHPQTSNKSSRIRRNPVRKRARAQ